MELTNGQNEAVAMTRKLMHSIGFEVAVLEGYAGTGKTTLVGMLRQELGDQLIPNILVLTPTGKAAVRAREVTGLPASTIHRWLYHPMVVNGKVRFAPKTLEELQQYAGYLIVIDEASMVGVELWRDLERAFEAIGHVKVLLVGDGFQLPPVDKEGDVSWCALDFQTPLRTRMEEVLRQASESRVIQAATKLRRGASPNSLLSLLRWIEVEEASAEALAAWERGSAIIVHSNNLRRALNGLVRRAKGFGKDLVPGEPLLVMKNSYNLDMFNGEIVTFGGWTDPPGTYSAEARTKYSPFMMDFGLAMVDGKDALLCPEQVAEEFGQEFISTMSAEDAAGEAWMKRKHTKVGPYLNAVHGYALTAHKAQGSEWDEAMVFVEQSVQPNTELGRRWTYTAITRAKSTASLVMVPRGFHEQL